MKFISFTKYLALVCAACMLALTGCSPDDTEAELGPVPTTADVTFTATPDPANPNIVHFTNSSEGFIAVWDLGNGTTARGNEAQASYPVKGDYTVKLTIMTSGGSATSEKVINIAETNPLMLDIPVYNFLTGGADALDGKTWVIDKETPGHMGIGPSSSTTPEWWSAPALDKNGKGIYDDEFTFKLAGFSYVYQTNGNVYSNQDFGPTVFPGAVREAGGNDWIAPYTPPANTTWTLTETAPGKWTLIINGSFMGYYVATNTYEILSINDDEMHVRYIQGNNPGNAWYHKFIRKGFTRPVEAPEYKIEDVHDDFEGSGNLTFFDDGGGSIAEGYDNPAPVGINTSAKVGKYVKANGAGSAFANVQLRFDYKMDLRDRHVFKLKVFVPGYNDYTTEAAESWQSYKTLQKQVSVKLQNRSLGGNAWTTQTEIIKQVTETDKWIELTFDFTGAASREDYDQIVIQIGGEANHTGGIFFIDDFELL
jgi:hypothetical protein